GGKGLPPPRSHHSPQRTCTARRPSRSSPLTSEYPPGPQGGGLLRGAVACAHCAQRPGRRTEERWLPGAPRRPPRSSRTRRENARERDNARRGHGERGQDVKNTIVVHFLPPLRRCG